MVSMNRCLAIETSGRKGSIAVVEQGVVVDEREFEHGLHHAAQVLPIIDQMTRARGWQPGDIEQVYISQGPGSFTGLRIGITLVKTLALATGVKIVAVPTMRVLVANAPEEARQVIIVLDAKRGQIFTARFKRGAGVWIEAEAARIDTLAAMLDRAGRPVHLLGEGLPFHLSSLVAGDAGVILTEDSRWRAKASVVAGLGMEMARAGQFADPLTLSPLYLRKPEALEKWENAQIGSDK